MFNLRTLLFFCLFANTATAQDIEALLASASADKGKLVAQACQACHVLDKSTAVKFGPTLYNVVGRDIASLEGYDYSAALKAQTGVWDYARLDAFLANPMQNVPGTKMAYPGVTVAADRAALIAYLRLQSDDPLALPEVSEAEMKKVSAAKEIPEEMQLMPEGEGRETVFYVCNSCHSVRLVVQQGMSRSSWKDTLEWMVEEQGMDEMDDETEKVVLDYLSKYIGIESHTN